MLHEILRHARGNAVAYAALFVALSGTAVAASVKLSANSVGTAQLKNGAVTGKKVAKNTLTGANIKASTLGPVPNATHATNAATATNAASATNALHATNTAELGGQPAASFQSRVSGTCTSGTAIASIGAAGTVGCQSTNVTQMMGGIEQINPSAAHQYLGAEGLTPTADPTETDGIGASSLAATAGHLDVGIFTLQPVGVTVTLDVNDTPTALTCTIPASGGTCSDSTDTASIPAGALVDVSVTGSGLGVPTQLVFGWTDTTGG